MLGGFGRYVPSQTGASPSSVGAPRGSEAAELQDSSTEAFTAELGRSNAGRDEANGFIDDRGRWPIIPKREDRQVCLITC